MSDNTVNLPEQLFEALNQMATHLGKTPQESVELALNFFLQLDTVDNAIIAKERFDEKAELVAISLEEDEDEEEELEYELKFHPEALEEYELLDEEQQMLVICGLVGRLFEDEESASASEDEEEEEIESYPEMLLHDSADTQLILTHFPFGDLVYAVNEDAVAIYLVNFHENEEIDEEEFDEFDDEDEEEDEELKVLS